MSKPSPRRPISTPSPPHALRVRSAALRSTAVEFSWENSLCVARRGLSGDGLGRVPPVKVLGVNAVFHDPASALVVDGEIVAAAEEERFTRRKHGKLPVPFATWEVPEQSAAWCLTAAGIGAEDLDAVAYSYDPELAPAPGDDITADGWEDLRT